MERQTSWIWMKLCTEWPFSWVLTICPIRSPWTDRQRVFKHGHIYYAFLLGQTDNGFSNSATYTMRSYWTDKGFSNSSTYSMRSYWTDRQRVFKHGHIYYAFLLDRQTKGFQTSPHTLCVLIEQTDKMFSNIITYIMCSYWTDRQRVFKHGHIYYAFLLGQTDKGFSNIAPYTMHPYWTDRQCFFKHCHIHYAFLLDRQTKGFQTVRHTPCVLIGQTDNGFSNMATYTMCSYWTDRQRVFKQCDIHYVFLLDRQTKGFQISPHTLCVLIGQTDTANLNRTFLNSVLPSLLLWGLMLFLRVGWLKENSINFQHVRGQTQ